MMDLSNTSDKDHQDDTSSKTINKNKATLNDCDGEDVDVSGQERDVATAVSNVCGANANINDCDVEKNLPNIAECRSSSDRKQSNRTSSMVQRNDESISESESSQETKEIDTGGDEVNRHGMAIGNKESKEINRFKFIVILILLAVAVISSTCVVVFIRNAEQNDFEEKFQSDALKVLESVRNSIDNTLIPLDNLAVALVSHAKAHTDEWPFVTLEDFAVRVAKILPLTDAIWITVLPVVTPEKRSQWENYSSTHDEWVVEAVVVQDTWELYYGPKNLTYDPERSAEVGGIFGPLEANISRVMLPQWQIFPEIPAGGSAYNFDWLAVEFPQAPLECYSTHRSILSDAYLIPEPDNPDVLIEAQMFVENFALFINASEDPYEPVMDIFYPIIDDISRVKVVGSDNYDAENNTLVGVLAATVYWRNIIRNTLPPGSNGISIVFNNSCTKSFTYQINGPEVVFVGVNDKHDKKYDHLRVSSKITELEDFSFTASVYTGAPISEDFCPYTLHIYPTDEMKSEFTTKNGAIYALVTFLVILSLGLVFVMYDCKVERRQKKVLSSAMRSSEIVSSLFPTSVQDQLYPIHNGNNDKRSPAIWPTGSNLNDDFSDVRPIASGPIATLYPDTTVMFADIKGFTQWSADRQPTQVFHLLESLYGAFDALAKLYGIFKVETIGDTYVAVVGLPTPRKQHAILMVRFAKKCLIKMTEVTRKLEATLGPGTTDLSLRVGLNSGPTTAGVLRGEKARFQLFGDTVNTASRMESNGESNKIHVSPSTAELIEQSGKGNWLTLRESTIMVKGKGEMQTFWCDPIKNPQSSSDGGSTNQSNTNDDSNNGDVDLAKFDI